MKRQDEQSSRQFFLLAFQILEVKSRLKSRVEFPKQDAATEGFEDVDLVSPEIRLYLLIALETNPWR